VDFVYAELTVLLSDLIAQREIGVKVVFTIKRGAVLNCAFQGYPGAQCQVNTYGIEPLHG